MIHVMNSAMMPAEGRYTLHRISLDQWIESVKAAHQSGHIASSIGYWQNLDIIFQLTGVRLQLSREPTHLQPGDTMLIMRLKYRPENKGKVEPKITDFEFFIAHYAVLS